MLLIMGHLSVQVAVCEDTISTCGSLRAYCLHAPGVLFSLSNTCHFPSPRSHTARLVSAAEDTRRGLDLCFRAELHLPLVPLSRPAKADTVGTRSGKLPSDAHRKPYNCP
jgi:hypothetical protein